jgi:phosphate transport system substrate-binding protein
VVGAVVIVAILIGVGYETHWYGLQPATSTAPGSCPTDVTLSGAGASFLTALMSQWETSYTADTQNKINYNPSGAGAGITSFTDNLVNFAATDEPLTDAQFAALPGTTLTLPVTGGAVTIIYNLPGFTGPLQISGTQLAGIYLGTITNWDDSSFTALNPGLPNQPIIPVVRSDPAGTSYVLTNYLSDDNSTFNSTVGISIQPAWPSLSSEVEEHGNSALSTYVASTAGKYSIGYVDLADAIAHNTGGIAAVGNPSDDYILPNVTNTQSAINYMATHQHGGIPAATANWAGVTFVNSPQAADYPLATLSYFLVLQNPGSASSIDPSLAYTQVLVQFLGWAITSGQPYAAPLEYIVPTAALLTQDSNAIQAINYNGASIPACSS